jgi:hypothetical protein
MGKGMFGRGDLAWCVGQKGLAVVTGGQCQKLMGLVHCVETEEISNFDSLGPLNLVREKEC